MKISDVEKRVNASYNTIKRFIEKDDNYNEIIGNVLHATDLGIEQLEKEYGIRTEILSDENVIFYSNQISFLQNQLQENKKYNDLFMKQIELRDAEVEEIKARNFVLEELNRKNELEKLELKHQLELEKNKSLWRRIFRKEE